MLSFLCGNGRGNQGLSPRRRNAKLLFRQTHTHSSTSSKATAKAILKKYGSRGILAAFFYCINVTDSEPLEIRKNNASCRHVSNLFFYRQVHLRRFSPCRFRPVGKGLERETLLPFPRLRGSGTHYETGPGFLLLFSIKSKGEHLCFATRVLNWRISYLHQIFLLSPA